ncbi:MAG: DUF2341 domain-containing protein [Candidatus Komeilibacteria bacterium]
MLKLAKKFKINPQRWQPPALGILITAIIIVFAVVYFLRTPGVVQAEWWNEGWHYRDSYPITYSSSGSELTEYQVLVEDLDTATLIAAGKMQSDCADIRFTDVNSTVLNYSIVGATCNTSNTKIWVKMESIPAGGTTLYLYYGNPSASFYQSEENTFSYSTEKTVGYVLNDGSTAFDLISLADGNSITHNSTTLTLNKGESSALTTSTYLPVTAKKLFNMSTEEYDTIVPIGWAGTEFVYQNRNGTYETDFVMVSPWGTATVQIYIDGVQCGADRTVTSSGLKVTDCGGAASDVFRIVSDIPIIVNRSSSVNDPHPMHPADLGPWYGWDSSGDYIAAGPSGASYQWIDSGMSSVSSSSLGANAGTTLEAGGGSYYSGDTIKVWSTDYVMGASTAGDADGGDATTYLPNWEFGTITGSPYATDFVAVLSDQAVTCTTYNNSGATVNTQQLSSTNTQVYELGGTNFGIGSTSEYISGAWYVECDGPAMFVSQNVDDEQNMWSWPMMRQFSYPTPAVGSASGEEKGEAPILYWKFDEGVDNSCSGGGDVCDSTTTGDHRNLVGEPDWQSEDMCVSGKCLYFDGTNDYIDLGFGSGRNLATDPLSISMWVRPTSSSEDNMYIATVNGTNQRFYFAIQNGLWDMGIQNSTWSQGGAVTSADLNEWTHIAIVANGSAVRLYVNGNYSFQKTYTSYALAGNIAIASQGPAGGYKWRGSIDDVKIYNYARTDDQIKADYLAGLSGSSSGVGASLGSRQQDQSEGLVGYWQMDDAGVDAEGETISDSSGNGNSGTLYGDNATGDNGTGMDCTVTGKYGTGCSFDGVDDYVLSSSNIPAMSNFTISVWLQWDDYGTSNTQFVTGGAQEQFEIQTGGGSGTNGLRFIPNTHDASTLDVANAIPDANWHHYAVVYTNNDQVLAYRDGDEIGNKSHSVSSSTTASQFNIGRRSNNSYFFDGKIDNVKIYNTARTAEQIMRDYKTGPSPVAYYDFEEQSTSIAYDRSGTGVNLTATGLDSTNIGLGKYGSAYKYTTWEENHIGTASSICNTITMEAWIYPLSDPAERYTIVFYSGSQAAYLSYANGQALNTYWASKSSPGYHTSGASTVPINQWSHVAAVWDDAGVSLYVNGIEKNRVSTTGGSCTGTSLTLAAQNSGRQMNGYIDDVRIYDYPRTQEQILWDMYGDESPHPIAYWNFDEGYGSTVNDSGPLGADGTITGGTWTTDGKLANGVSINSTDSISCGTHSGLIFGSADHSFSAWVKPSALTNSNNYIVAIGNNATGEQSGFGVKSDGDLFHSAYSSPLVSFDTSVSTGNWYHLALVHDSGTSYAYVNGEQVSGQAIAMNITTGKCYIGAHTAAGSTFNDGILDEVKIFNFALSPEQVRQEYNQGSQVSLGKQKNDSSTWDDGGFGGAAPVAYWNFEEGSGSTVYDRSVNSNNGTITNATYTLGKPGWGMQFDPTNEYVSIPDHTALKPTEITVEAWVKPGTTMSNNRIISKTEVSGYTMGMAIDGTADSNFYVYRDGGYINAGWDVSNFSSGTWYHMVGTYDGQYIKFYVNGDLKESVDAIGNYPITYIANNLCIGIEAGGTTCTDTRDFDGVIDEVKIFDYARTQAQIAYDYNGGKPVGWWPLDNNEGITAMDISGNGNHGTLTDMDPATDWLDGTSCQYEGCLDFDGMDDYVDISSYDISTPSFTASLWFNMTTLEDSDYNILLQQTDSGSGTGRTFLGIHTTTNDIFTNIGNSQLTSGIIPDTGTWYHAVVSFDGSNLKLYVNGKLENSTTDVLESANASILIGAGKSFSATQFFDGKLDDVRIYNYDLTADQVKEVMNHGAVYFK